MADNDDRIMELALAIDHKARIEAELHCASQLYDLCQNHQTALAFDAADAANNAAHSRLNAAIEAFPAEERAALWRQVHAKLTARFTKA